MSHQKTTPLSLLCLLTLEREQNGQLCVGKIPAQLMYKIADGPGNWYQQSTHNFDQWDAMPPEECHYCWLHYIRV